MSGDDPVSRNDGLAEAPPEFRFHAGSATAVVPFAPSRARSTGPAAARDQTATTRVLLIDDCNDDVLLIQELLARAEGGSFRVEHAADAQDGLTRLLRGEHDVALVEHRLTGEDGLSFARAAGRRGLTTPLIILSASDAPGGDVAAIDAGAADFLDKEELAVERLERAIRMALARQRRSLRVDPPPLLDPLTGLSGRHAYLDRLDQALGRARRRRGHVAVMLLDIDRFGEINRTYGHAAGDSLLRLLGGRIRRHLRETDTTARLVADRFALILEDLARPEHAQAVSVKLLATIAGPVSIAGETVAVTASAGAALFPGDGPEAAGLLALAEAALDAAKREGGHRYRYTADRQRALPAGNAMLATALDRAIGADALGLLFQPQVTLCSPELGLAALVRWQNGPADCMDCDRVRELAEATALTEPLTDWLLAAACRQAARWRTAGLPSLHVAVPLLSRRELAWSDLVRRLDGHLASAGMTPGELELEIDETLLLDPHDATARALAGVRELGVRLAVAGFGAGSTSLAVLRDLPLTTVKLARQLLTGIPEQEARTAVTSTIVRLSVQLDLRVVADGVETQAQLRLLRSLGCDAVQSLTCCPPLPADACADWLGQAERRP